MAQGLTVFRSQFKRSANVCYLICELVKQLSASCAKYHNIEYLKASRSFEISRDLWLERFCILVVCCIFTVVSIFSFFIGLVTLSLMLEIIVVSLWVHFSKFDMMNRIPCTTHDSPMVIKFPFNWTLRSSYFTDCYNF